MTYDVTFLDPRHDPEPDFWDTWRRAAGLWANWGWPVMRAGAWHSRAPLLLAVLRRPGEHADDRPGDLADNRPGEHADDRPGDRPGERAGERAIAGVVAASVRSVARRARFCPAHGYPTVGYLDVAAPQSTGQPGWWFDTAEAAERAALFRAYTRAARRELRMAAAGVLWRQVGPHDVPALPRRLLVRPTLPVAVLATPFRDRAGWLATLRPSRRTDMRRVTRILEQDGDLAIKAGAAGDMVTAAELTRLARLNFDKHSTVRADRCTGVRAHGWNRALLEHDDVAAVAYRDGGGRLLGVGLILEHPSRPLLLSWGAETIEEGGRRHMYFDLYSRVVDLATASRSEALMLGKGLPALKADLGAQLMPQFAVAARTG